MYKEGNSSGSSGTLGSNIPIVTALYVKFARRRFRRCFIPSIIIIYVATCLRHNTKSTLFITLQAGSPRPEARPKRLCALVAVPGYVVES